MQVENQPVLKVFLVDLVDKQTNKEVLEDRMRELENLVNTYGGVVVLQKYQKKDHPDLRTYVGKGKLEEIIADMLRRLYRLLGEKFNAQKSVGIIVPYRNQIAMIRKEIEKLGIPALEDISIDTVERYQGSQRDIILYSFTIQSRYQLDFLTANTFYEDGQPIDRKLNVAITRARKQLILTGNEPTLRQNQIFAELIDYIKEKGGYYAEKA